MSVKIGRFEFISPKEQKKRSQAALAAWETRRHKAFMRSHAAYKAWRTRREQAQDMASGAPKRARKGW